MRRIVLTGGPGAGKTTICARLAADEPERFAVVPEAATQVYAMLPTRWAQLDDAGRRDLQRRIYHLQLEQEQRAAAGHPEKLLLLDRGTIDGAAYWPEGPADYWRQMTTTLERELARYDAVIWLECAAAIGAYDAAASNACREEPPGVAIALGQCVAELWSAHPRLVRINACATVDQKLQRVRVALAELCQRA